VGGGGGGVIKYVLKIHVDVHGGVQLCYGKLFLLHFILFKHYFLFCKLSSTFVGIKGT